MASVCYLNVQASGAVDGLFASLECDVWPGCWIRGLRLLNCFFGRHDGNAPVINGWYRKIQTCFAVNCPQTLSLEDRGYQRRWREGGLAVVIKYIVTAGQGGNTTSLPLAS